MSEMLQGAAQLVDLIKRRAPEYLDLLTSETDEQFESAFTALLERALMGLEQNRKLYRSLDEDGLSSVLALALEVPGLQVSRELYSNGHVDITIEAAHCTPARRKLGEAKIYDGYKYHVSGLEQLLGRYTTGREGRGLLIVYCRQPDVKGKFKALRASMDAELPCKQQGVCSDGKLRWSFLSGHVHASGEVIGVDHVGCNLCQD